MHGHALHFAQFALHGIHVLAVVQGHVGGQVRTVAVAAQIFRHQRDAGDAFGRHLLRHHRYGNQAVHGLAARHGDGVVVEDFVGDVDLGRLRGADGQIAGMEIRAVAQVLEHVRQFGECGLADPRRAFATHVRGQLVHFRVDRGGHHVATDAGQRQAAVRHLGRGIVRAAGAVKRGAERRVDGLFQDCILGVEET